MAPKWGKTIGSWRGHNKSTCPIPPLCSKKILKKWPVSLSKHDANMRKSIGPWLKCNQFQIWSGYTSMRNVRLSLPSILKKIPETPNLTSFNKSKWRQMRKINRPWPKPNLFWRWSEFINIHNLMPFPPCVVYKMSGNRKFDLFSYL